MQVGRLFGKRVERKEENQIEAALSSRSLAWAVGAQSRREPSELHRIVHPRDSRGEHLSTGSISHGCRAVLSSSIIHVPGCYTRAVY